MCVAMNLADPVKINEKGKLLIITKENKNEENNNKNRFFQSTCFFSESFVFYLKKQSFFFSDNTISVASVSVTIWVSASMEILVSQQL